jgi:hypothetical protein
MNPQPHWRANNKNVISPTLELQRLHGISSDMHFAIRGVAKQLCIIILATGKDGVFDKRTSK